MRELIRIYYTDDSWLTVSEEEHEKLRQMGHASEVCDAHSAELFNGRHRVAHVGEQSSWGEMCVALMNLRRNPTSAIASMSLREQYEQAHRELLEGATIYGPREFVENAVRLANFKGFQPTVRRLSEDMASARLAVEH